MGAPRAGGLGVVAEQRPRLQTGVGPTGAYGTTELRYTKLLDGTWGVTGWGACPAEGTQLDVVRRDGTKTVVYVLDIVERGSHGRQWKARDRAGKPVPSKWIVRVGRSATVVTAPQLVAAIEAARARVLDAMGPAMDRYPPTADTLNYVRAVDELLGRLGSLIKL